MFDGKIFLLTATGNDVQVTLRVNVVNKPIVFVNAATVSKTALERFAESFVNTVAFNALYQQVDFLQNFFVALLPKDIA